jgi:hypothetical protein
VRRLHHPHRAEWHRLDTGPRCARGAIGQRTSRLDLPPDPCRPVASRTKLRSP